MENFKTVVIEQASNDLHFSLTMFINGELRSLQKSKNWGGKRDPRNKLEDKTKITQCHLDKLNSWSVKKHQRKSGIKTSISRRSLASN